jgi:mono/diheme cytochrome c family protein
MRGFLIGFLLVVAAILAVAGFRGGKSPRPPIELFADMVRQPKLRPQAQHEFLPDTRASLAPPAGAIARGQPCQDNPVYTGWRTGTTNFIETNPLPITRPLLARGQERFQIHCAPCHGAQADGNSVGRKIGAMAIVANLHDKRIVALPDGEVFYTITNGKNLMSGYASQVALADRWAIIAYLRALQLSRLATLDEVPPEMRATLKP